MALAALIFAFAAPAVLVSIPTPSKPRAGVPLSSSFEIAFVNASPEKLNLLNENCIWGYEMVKFEIEDKAGHQYKIERAQRPWLKNFPSPMLLQPGDVALRTINLTDGTWSGLPAGGAGASGPWRVRVILEIKSDGLVKAPEVWIGTAASRWHLATPL